MALKLRKVQDLSLYENGILNLLLSKFHLKIMRLFITSSFELCTFPFVYHFVLRLQPLCCTYYPSNQKVDTRLSYVGELSLTGAQQTACTAFQLLLPNE